MGTQVARLDRRLVARENASAVTRDNTLREAGGGPRNDQRVFNSIRTPFRWQGIVGKGPIRKRRADWVLVRRLRTSTT
jgi:hypothetical protein